MERFPIGWTKTVANLCDEVLKEHRNVPQEEFAWARAYERSLLKPWARFPQDGEVFEALGDTPVQFLTSWSAPFTGGGDGLLKRGSRVRVNVPKGESEPIGVYADPLDYKRLEDEMVPEHDRLAANYSGFYLSISTDLLNRAFRLVMNESDEVK
jgi:hypothetical protein